MKQFKTKEELQEFIVMNIPLWVKSNSKNAKYHMVNAYTSGNALKIIVETLTDKLWSNEEI